ncbi:major facilitator superfamily transporter [Colletotrichum sublineola]|uniref:Putative major facilitator superfamily transporter n=1 Tax=Colletotrichum sublineola TaxID=1173701 RepID=A0A066WSZ9_COLSU|nr:major facilitator superfamily transporter [Colletotrichum sublineola]KDN60028.1 putative major facilitator superfamily transporter [Colletotrichum sublineola]
MASVPASDGARASRPTNKEDATPTRDSSVTRVGRSFDAEKHQRPDDEKSGGEPNGGFFEDGPGRDEESEGTRSHDEDLAAANSRMQPEYTPDGKRIITEEECDHILGYSWPTWKKWMLLSSIFAVQVSMNFNTSVFPSAVTPISEAFHVSEQAARTGQCAFLVLYAFGCELWAPWSEEFGRWTILQCSLFLVNMWQILAALAPHFGSIVVARGLGGLSSAGGSVTIGMVADLYQPEEQQWAVLFVVLSSVFGTSVGPVVGGPIQKFLPWYWNFWIQLIFGVAVQAIHFFMPESRATIIMDREAKRRRKSGEDTNVYGPNEVKKPRLSMHEFTITWLRPFEMFVREPIVLSCSLLSGFSDALIFTFQEGFAPVFNKWGFGTLEKAWAFIPVNIGYLLAYISFIPWIIRDHRVIRAKGPDALAPERRLQWLLYLAPLETIGLFGFAWTSMGPPESHWIAPMIFSCLIAIANFAIYMSTIDYMVASYGPYSASATGGNGFARDFLAGISAMYAVPLYENIGDSRHTEYASTILACLALMVTIPVYVIYWKGPVIRERSKFAQSLEADRRAKGGRRVVAVPEEQLEPENL